MLLLRTSALCTTVSVPHSFSACSTALQTCDVMPLLPGDALTLHNADACEAAVYSTTQQLYALLSGLLELAETGGAVGLAAKWSGGEAGAGALRRLLPRPVVPPKAQVGVRAAILACHDLLNRVLASCWLAFLLYKLSMLRRLWVSRLPDVQALGVLCFDVALSTAACGQ
jgi:hypothetical protein